MRKMSVQHTNFNTSQDKGKTGQEVNNQELIKKKSPDKSLASIFLAVAFYLAIVYLVSCLIFALRPVKSLGNGYNNFPST